MASPIFNGLKTTFPSPDIKHLTRRSSGLVPERWPLNAPSISRYRQPTVVASRSGAVAGAWDQERKTLVLENPELRARRVAGLAKANAMLKEQTKANWHGSRITNGKTLEFNPPQRNQKCL
jgi:hypothetical protein